MSNPIILYKSVLETGGDLSATNTAAGYDVNNIKDLRTHTFWKANAAGTLYITEAPLAEDAVALADMILSLVDGTAFVDFSAADVLTDYISKRIVIIDSAGKKIIGYIKAAGTAETYQILSPTACCTDPSDDQDNTTGWVTNGAIDSVAGGRTGNTLELTAAAANKTTSLSYASIAGAAYKMQAYFKSGTQNTSYVNTGAGYNMNTGDFVCAADWSTVKNFVWTETLTSAVKHIYLHCRIGAGTIYFDDVLVRKVLTPSATGVTVVNTPNGSTYNWESIETGFNYNDAAGYTYKISEADSVDALGIEGHNLGTAGAAVSVESSDDESTWTERLAAFNPSDDTAILKTMTSFRAASKRLKIVTASVAPYLAVAMLGDRLEFNKGAYIGDGAIVPWQFGIIAVAQRSKTGNLLGNTIRYKPIDISMTIPTDTYDWFNTYFWPFWRDHGSLLKPFFFAPDLTTFTDKIFWLQLTEDSVLAPPMLMKDRVDQYTFIMRGVLEE